MLVFGVSFDSAEANSKFATEDGFPFPLLCDTERKMGLAFGACADPKAAYAARYTFVVGPDGSIELAIDTSDAGGQAQALLPDLKRLVEA